MARWRTKGLVLLIAALLALSATHARAQAAVLMEEPYGVFGTLNPTGHTAIYFSRICAETPVHLRRCHPGEMGSVISRYEGIAGYDWVAMPLLPYFYSVDTVEAVPERVNKATVRQLRSRYHEQHMGALGRGVFEGNNVRGGWTQMVGVAYERRIYAFQFATTEEQDDAMIARLNDRPNRSDFNLIYSNCADFARSILNVYFPRIFKRALFPDAGMTTPRQITYKLVRYAGKHPEMHLEVYEIPQIPGYRHLSRSNKSVAASLMTSVYAIPITILNPYLAGGLFVDYLVRGRYPLVAEHPEVLTPESLAALTAPPGGTENPEGAGQQVSGAADGQLHATPADVSVHLDLKPGLKEIVATHEPN
jgi:hypothetical protein